MDVFLTLDYELFLGNKSGSVDACLIKPMNALAKAASSANARFTIFTDATYLLRLTEMAPYEPTLADDLKKITDQLRLLSDTGHDIELHIHPQWLFSEYRDGQWLIDQQHYKLSDITLQQAQDTFSRCCEIIKNITGRTPVAFRAGGFSAQPTDMLRRLLKDNNLSIDSSVYPGNKYTSPQQNYDYSDAPSACIYRFSDDICKPSPHGDIIEVPLSVYGVSPLFYWRLAAQRIMRSSAHRRLGDGISVKTTGSSIRNRLTHRTDGFATIDEMKISYLPAAFAKALRDNADSMCIIGHPKLASAYSLKRLPAILKNMLSQGAVFKTVNQLL